MQYVAENWNNYCFNQKFGLEFDPKRNARLLLDLG